MRPRVVLSIGNFFFALFSTLLTYVTIPYLTTYMTEVEASLVIAVGALVSCVVFPLMPAIAARYGAQQLAVVIAILELLSLLALAAVPGAIGASIFAAIAFALGPFLAYQLDLLLEATVAEEGVTARVRTIFITAWNVAALAGPLILGALLARDDAYHLVFLAAAAATLPFITLFVARKLPTGAPPQLAHMKETLRCISRDRDLSAVTFAHFLLYLFFIWAPFYTPLYLHEIIGIPWSDLGWIFAIMLIPYVIVEYPAGLIADLYIGDKELLMGGFLLAGSSLAAMSLFTPNTPIIFIVMLLVASRIGAALTESMTEGHFFRRVSEKDVNSISIFRGIWPLANLVGPVAASLILIFGNYQLFFVITGGFIAIAGVISTAFIKDFR